MTLTAFHLPDHLSAKADPALIAARRAALRGDRRGRLEQSFADLTARLDAAAQGAAAAPASRRRTRPRDPPAHRPAAHPAPLRARPVPRPHGRRGRRRAGLRRAARPHRQRRAAGCCSTGARPPPSRSSAPPTPTRWAWPAGAATAGPGGRISDYWDEVFTADGFAGHAARSTTSPRSSPASAATGRRGCATCSAPSRPTRTRSSAPGRAARSSSTAGRAPARPSSRCTAPRTCSTPTRGSAHRRGGVLFVGPHQPYLDYVADVLPEPRRGGRADLHAAGPGRRGRRGRGRDRPGGRAAQGIGRAGARRSRPAVRFYEEPPTKALTVDDALVRRLAQRRDWAEAFDAAEPGTAAQRGPRPGLGGAAHAPGRQVRRRRARDRTRCAGTLLRRPRPARRLQPRVAAAGSRRRGRRSLVGARLSAHVRARG